jgi:uncharacterized protein YndB with AHSA1/START domain
MKQKITVETTVNAPIEKVWEYWNEPRHITKWNNASPDWHSPTSTNDLKVGGKFMTRMEAKDGSEGFDFTGTYTKVDKFKKIEYTMDGEDERKVEVFFEPGSNTTKITETFESEEINPIEMQKAGWQSIMDNFKKYIESTFLFS